MTRLAPRVASFIVAVVALVGCHGDAPAKQQPAPVSDVGPTDRAAGAGDAGVPAKAESTAPKAEIKDQRALPEPPSVEAFVGRPCRTDQDCKFYLRCRNAACSVPPAIKGDGDTSTAPVMSISGSQGEGQFYLELATTDPQRARGLMFRPEMSDLWGMLFVYPADDQLSFWMRNTYIPLDMIFIDDTATVVGVVENATPLTLDHREVAGKSRYVLEVNAGIAERFGIDKGSKVRFNRLPPAFLPRGNR